MDEKFVPYFMSILIIYSLQSINVCEYEGTDALSAGCRLTLGVEPFLQVANVIDSGKQIGLCLLGLFQ